MTDIPSLTDAEFEAIMAGPQGGGFPRGGGTRAKVLPEEFMTEWGPLDESHLAAYSTHVATGASVGYEFTPLKAIRNTHHRAAQLLAMGMDETKVARLCNYSVTRISNLKADPAFEELLAYYAAGVEEEFADFVTVAANLSMDFLGRLQEMLDESPEKFTPTHLMEAVKLLADRTGHAPVQKTHNVNVNVDLGTRLKAARERANAAHIQALPDA